MVSSTCFETESLSSGRRLYMQVRYSMFYMRQYKHSCRWKSESAEFNSSTYKTAYTDACSTYYTVPLYTTVFLKINSLTMNPRFWNIWKT